MKMRTKNNRLTAYALSCGCVEERYDEVTNTSTRMWVEHGTPHVRTIERDGLGSITGRDWRSFDSLKEARAHFNSCPGTVTQL